MKKAMKSRRDLAQQNSLPVELAEAQALMPIALSAEASEAVRMLALEIERQRKLKRSLRRAKHLRKILSSEFGQAFLGRTVDGRIVMRVHQSRDYDPLPAKTIAWDEFREIAPWDISATQ